MFSELIKPMAHVCQVVMLEGDKKVEAKKRIHENAFRFIGADKFVLVSIERAHDWKCQKLNGCDLLMWVPSALSSVAFSQLN